MTERAPARSSPATLTNRTPRRGIGLALCFAGSLAACTGESTTPDATVAPGTDAGPAVTHDGGRDAGAVAPGDDAGTGSDAAVACTDDLPSIPTASGVDHAVTAGASIADALAGAAPGDRIVLADGDYGAAQIEDLRPSAPIVITAAAGATARIAGLTLRGSSNLVFQGLTFTGTLRLEASDHVWLDEVDIDVGDISGAALHIHGQGSGGATHDVTVLHSHIAHGGRTVFILGRFAPSDEWNHHLVFRESTFDCGQNVCFQVSGGRDITIADNELRSTSTTGILTAGATRVDILRNRFRGGGGGAAMQLATPGREWDDFDGVENMISSDILVANNISTGFGSGVRLDATRDIDIVANTIPDGTSLVTNHRIPHDRSDNVIIEGNDDIRLWNNILGAIRIGTDDPRPTLESHNVVGDGGQGDGLIADDPVFEDTDSYRLTDTSPGRDAALDRDENPDDDHIGAVRDVPTDIGAVDRDGAPRCP